MYFKKFYPNEALFNKLQKIMCLKFFALWNKETSFKKFRLQTNVTKHKSNPTIQRFPFRSSSQQYQQCRNFSSCSPW